MLPSLKLTRKPFQKEKHLPIPNFQVLLLMAEILHQLIGSLSHYLQGFIHPRWLFGISSINSIKWKPLKLTIDFHCSIPKKWQLFVSFREGTWRTIPVSKWLITMVIVSPLSRVVGPFPIGRTSWLINVGY